MMRSKVDERLAPLCGTLILMAWTSLLADTQHLARAGRAGVPAAATSADIVQYVARPF